MRMNAARQDSRLAAKPLIVKPMAVPAISPPRM